MVPTQTHLSALHQSVTSSCEARDDRSRAMTLTRCCLTEWSTPKLLGKKCFMARVRLPVPQNSSIAKKPSSPISSILLKHLALALESQFESAKVLFFGVTFGAVGETCFGNCHLCSLCG